MWGRYDSPTFLGRESKLLFGLTFKQVMWCTVLAAIWLSVANYGPGSSTGIRLLLYVPCYLCNAVLLLYRIRGATVPGYICMFLSLQLRRRIFDSSFEDFCAGAVEWREDYDQEVRMAGGRLGRELDRAWRQGQKKAKAEEALIAASAGVKTFVTRLANLVFRGRMY